MGALYYMLHPYEFCSILQWKIWYDPTRKRNLATESPELSECFRLLHQTSRSFATVSQELNQELLVPVILFYLVLRGLDTIEDDMTISLERKVPLLLNFHETIEQDDWQFHESQEKDAELLERFNVVISELKHIKKAYFDIIKDITLQMGTGMADFAQDVTLLESGVQSIADYELYCHYVAGLVGDGLTRLFGMSGVIDPVVSSQAHLAESMGQLLQKTNVIRDVKEDWDNGRRWYPKEIWSKYITKWDDLFDSSMRESALNVNAEMVLDALKHVEDCLAYMSGIQDPSCFSFVAIPQTMVIATLDLVFRNPVVFGRNAKITKGEACDIMMQSTRGIRTVCAIFRKHVQSISDKSHVKDPNYWHLRERVSQIQTTISLMLAE